MFGIGGRLPRGKRRRRSQFGSRGAGADSHRGGADGPATPSRSAAADAGRSVKSVSLSHCTDDCQGDSLAKEGSAGRHGAARRIGCGVTLNGRRGGTRPPVRAGRDRPGWFRGRQRQEGRIGACVPMRWRRDRLPATEEAVGLRSVRGHRHGADPPGGAWVSVRVRPYRGAAFADPGPPDEDPPIGSGTSWSWAAPSAAGRARWSRRSGRSWPAGTAGTGLRSR